MTDQGWKLQDQIIGGGTFNPCSLFLATKKSVYGGHRNIRVSNRFDVFHEFDRNTCSTITVLRDDLWPSEQQYCFRKK